MKRGRKMRRPAERFWEKVEKTPTCWIWHGAKDPKKGYGNFAVVSPGANRKGKFTRSHIWAYTQLIGEVPEGRQLHHVCRRKDCVNPLHMIVVSQEQHTEIHSRDYVGRAA